MTTPPAPPRPAGWGWGFHFAAATTISALFVALAIVAYAMQRDSARERMLAASTNVAKLMANNVSDLLRRADVQLQTIDYYYRELSALRDLRASRINAFLFEQQREIPEIDYVRILDRDGVIRYSSSAIPEAPVSLADRDFFIAARDNRDAGGTFTGPVYGRLSKKWVVNISRRLEDPAGAFAGVVFIAIAIDQFERSFAAAELGRDGVAGLRLLDARLLYRYPMRTEDLKHIGQPAPDVEAIWREHPEGHYTVKSVVDGVERLYVYAKIDNAPIYVFVGRSTTEIRQSLAAVAFNLLLLAALAVVLIALATWRLYRMTRHREIAERTALEGAEKLRLAIEGAKFGTFDWNLAADVMVASDTCLDYFGLPRGTKPAPQSYFERIHPDDQPRMQRTVDDTVASRGSFDTEFRVRDAEGRERWLQAICSAIVPGPGEEVHLYGFNRDVTQRVAMEREIRALNTDLERRIEERTGELASALTRLTLAKNAAQVGIWHWSFIDDRLVWDEAIADWYELPERDRRAGITSETWRRRVHPEDLARAEGALARTRKEGTPFSETYRLVLSNGRIRHIQSAGVLEHDSRGTPIGMVGINRDVTLEQKLEEGLREAKAAAEAASQAKGNFLANLSHEIRTPMNTIVGLTDIALQTSLTAQQRDYLTKVLGSSRALLQLLNDILDYSKMEAGRLAMESAPFRFADVAHEVGTLFSVDMAGKGIAWKIDVGADVPDVLVGDPMRLRQVLVNLVGNALKFTERGEIRLSAALVVNTGAQATLRVTVTDTGAGMAPEVLGRLFQPFEQADASIARQKGGTGLGLSISRRLVEMMGGTIGVQSIPGAGSAFAFTATFGVAAVEADALPGETGGQAAARRLAREAEPIRGARVLVVDDNETHGGFARSLLESMGLSVTLATDGLKALEQARAGRFDAVLMELALPGIDGYEASRQLHAELGDACPPIIAFTALDREQVHTASLAAKMVDHVAKPVWPNALLAALLKWIRPRKPEAPPEPPAATRPLESLDHERIAALLAELRTALAGNRLHAKRIAEELAELLAGSALAPPYQPVVEAARRLAFRQALDALETFSAALPKAQ